MALIIAKTVLIIPIFKAASCVTVHFGSRSVIKRIFHRGAKIAIIYGFAAIAADAKIVSDARI